MAREEQQEQSLALGRDHQIIEPVHLMQALLDQQGGTVRASFGPFNTAADVEALCTAVAEIAG